jgi:hypothetical protein
MASVKFNNEPKTRRLKTLDEAKHYIEGGDMLENRWQTTLPADVEKYTRDSNKPKKGGIF